MNLHEMFPCRVVRGQDLPERGILIEITAMRPEKMRTGPDKPEEIVFVCYFNNIVKGAVTPLPGMRVVNGLGHGFVLRKKLAEQIFDCTQTTDTNDWKGKRLVAYPCKSRAGGKDVLSVCVRVYVVPRAPEATQPA